MDEKLRELFKEYIKENLSIELREFQDYGSKGFRVKLLLEDEEISSDVVYTGHWLD